MTGTVTGFSIEKNRDGTKDVVMLQVRFRDPEDIQTVELMTPACDDSIPPIGATVAVLEVSPEYKIAIAQRDEIDRDVDQGGKKIYSQSGDVIRAFIMLMNTGVIQINGDSDFVVGFTALKAGFDQLVSDHNLHVHTETGGTTTAPTVSSTANIDGAKKDDIKLP